MPAAFAEITQLADRCGYLACLFGSTVREGSGRDLDVMMVTRAREQQQWALFMHEFGGERVATFESLQKGQHSYEVAKAGKLYHFVFGRF